MSKRERGNCGGCGYRLALNKDGNLRGHSRLWCGGTRTTCIGSWKPPVDMETAMRAMLGKPVIDTAARLGAKG